MKKLISWALRYIPRKYLQYFSHLFLRAISVFYRGNNVECPISGRTYRKFLPYGRLESRENALCPDSLSLERHRLMWLFLKEKTDFFTGKHKLLHIAPELCFIPVFRRMENLEYHTADLESPLADIRLDVQNMPFEDFTYDIVFCNHVLEHVDDDIQAMKEIYRVLKPGGWAILQSPVYPEIGPTLEVKDADTPRKREQIYGQDDHQRKYGNDYALRLRSAGFLVREDDYVKTLSTEMQKRYALPVDEVIFFCQKTTDGAA